MQLLFAIHSGQHWLDGGGAAVRCCSAVQCKWALSQLASRKTFVNRRRCRAVARETYCNTLMCQRLSTKTQSDAGRRNGCGRMRQSTFQSMSSFPKYNVARRPSRTSPCQVQLQLQLATLLASAAARMNYL